MGLLAAVFSAHSPLPTGLDAHPLVREYFAWRLQEEQPEAWRGAHERLFEFLCDSVKEYQPNTLDRLQPLYEAVAHGCNADKQMDVVWKVYLPRIYRAGKCRSEVFRNWEKLLHPYSQYELGAFGTDLNGLTCFFDEPWQVPSKRLREYLHCFLLLGTGSALQAMNDERAIDVYKRALELAGGSPRSRISRFFEILCPKLRKPRLICASAAAAKLSSLHLYRGDIDLAVRYAAQGVRFANSAGDPTLQVNQRCRLAESLACAGKTEAARHQFEISEDLQRKLWLNPRLRNLSRPFLYALPGFQFCDFLLSQIDGPSSDSRKQLSEVRDRAEAGSNPPIDKDNLAVNGLNNLTLGRVCLMEADLDRERSSARSNAEVHLDCAVDLLHKAGQQDEQPRGLLHRAAFWRAQLEVFNEESVLSKAERDLADAEEIAGRGSMEVWQIEAALEHTRLYLTRASASCVRLNDLSEAEFNARAQGSKQAWLKQAQEKLDEAQRLIHKKEKPYEPHLPEWTDWQRSELVDVFKAGDIVGYHCRNEEIQALQQAIDRLSGAVCH